MENNSLNTIVDNIIDNIKNEEYEEIVEKQTEDDLVVLETIKILKSQKCDFKDIYDTHRRRMAWLKVRTRELVDITTNQNDYTNNIFQKICDESKINSVFELKGLLRNLDNNLIENIKSLNYEDDLSDEEIDIFFGKFTVYYITNKKEIDDNYLMLSETIEYFEKILGITK